MLKKQVELPSIFPVYWRFKSCVDLETFNRAWLHVPNCSWRLVFPLRKIFTKPIFVLVNMQLRNHAMHNQWSVPSVERPMRYMYDNKFGMLQVRENEISLRKWSGVMAQLHTVQGTLPAIEIVFFETFHMIAFESLAVTFMQRAAVFYSYMKYVSIWMRFQDWGCAEFRRLLIMIFAGIFNCIAFAETNYLNTDMCKS